MNVNLAETPVLPAIRSATAIVKVTPVTTLITPEETGKDTAGSALVCTVTKTLPEVGAPMVRPNSVTVMVAVDLRGVQLILMIMDVAPVAPGVMAEPTAESLAVGVALAAKKPEG